MGRRRRVPGQPRHPRPGLLKSPPPGGGAIASGPPTDQLSRSRPGGGFPRLGDNDQLSPERNPAMTDTQKPAKRTTAVDKTSTRFTAEERAAMKERAKELKADARRGSRADEADTEERRAREDRRDAGAGSRHGRADPRHRQGQRAGPHAEDLVRDARLRQGRQDRLLLPGRATSSSRGTRRSASATRRTSTTAPCGRSPSR